MKHYLLLCLILLLPLGVVGQNVKGELKSFNILNPTVPQPHFGGISAIEYVPAMKSWLLVTDRADKSGHDNTSYIFTAFSADSVRATQFNSITTISGLENVESYRYNATLKRSYFATEHNMKSIIGFINAKGKPEPLYEVEVSSELEKRRRQISKNRGIEGLMFDEANNLWFSLESGGETDCPKATTTCLFRVPYDSLKKQYDFKEKIAYTYSFSGCSCSTALTGILGNGISEILSYDKDHILVLERCYDGEGNGNNVNLFLARIDHANQKIYKEGPVFFNFNKKNDKYTRLDNLEGMTWGPTENGLRTLYFISDDNFNANKPKPEERQETQLIVLTIPGKP